MKSARADYAALLESSTAVTKKLERQVQELRSQLETEKTRSEDAWEEMEDSEKTLVAVRSENSELAKTCDELRSELSDLKQNSDSDFDSAGKAGEVVSWLRKEVGKALPKQITVKAIQKILEG